MRPHRRLRRLVVGETSWLWSVRHSHGSCRETLSLFRSDVAVTLRIVFAAGPERFVAEGLWYSGCAANGKGDLINLREPGIVRRVMGELAARGELPNKPGRYEVDGWTLFDALAKD